MTREQIEALSDDPDEMPQQLQDMAGPERRASASTASKAGSCRPSRRSSRSTSHAMHLPRRITRPAASSSTSSRSPASVPLRGGMNIRLRDGSHERRVTHSPRSKGPSARRTTGSSRRLADQEQELLFHQPQQPRRRSTRRTRMPLCPASARSPGCSASGRATDSSASALFDYAITRDQTLRISFNRNRSTSHNLGIGGSDEAERAYSTENTGHFLRSRKPVRSAAASS